MEASVIWAILAVLGVPLWVVAGGIAYMFLTNRRLRHRDGDVPVRARQAPGKRWRRGHGLWVGDVFAYRSSPSSWSESLDLVRSATLRELSPEETHLFRRLTNPVIAVLATDDRTFEVAAEGARSKVLLGPFSSRNAGAETRVVEHSMPSHPGSPAISA
jgi:hypothetical protein